MNDGGMTRSGKTWREIYSDPSLVITESEETPLNWKHSMNKFTPRTKKAIFKAQCREARLGNLGSLAMSVSNDRYNWLLHEVYDIRFPRLGNDRHFGWPRCFDPLKTSTANRLRWKRQAAYVAQIKFCPRCQSSHHQFQECVR